MTNTHLRLRKYICNLCPEWPGVQNKRAAKEHVLLRHSSITERDFIEVKWAHNALSDPSHIGAVCGLFERKELTQEVLGPHGLNFDADGVLEKVTAAVSQVNKIGDKCGGRAYTGSRNCCCRSDVPGERVFKPHFSPLPFDGVLEV